MTSIQKNNSRVVTHCRGVHVERPTECARDRLPPRQRNMCRATVRTNTVVDFRKSKSVPSTLIVNNSEVEIVDSFKFLGIHITSNLSWSLHARYMCKKGQQRLYFLRCLKKFHMKPEILVNFYRSINESILTGSIMVWFGNMTESDRNALSRVIRTARRLTGVDLPDLREIFYCRVKSRFHKVITDPSHPAFTFFELLPSGKRYRSLGYSGMSSRTSNSLYPTAVRVLNDVSH